VSDDVVELRPIVFRMPLSVFALWPLLHAVAWAAAAGVLGAATFIDLPPYLLIGSAIGFGHALIQWIGTSALVEGGTLVLRNLVWVRRITTSEIETVHRLRRRSWRSVSVTLTDGTEIMIPAPVSASLMPNPHFEEDLHRFCAAIAFADPAIR
jgi:hypothetical protein